MWHRRRWSRLSWSTCHISCGFDSHLPYRTHNTSDRLAGSVQSDREGLFYTGRAFFRSHGNICGLQGN